MSSIHLVAPSGYCLQQEAALRGVQRLEDAGHQVHNQQVISRRYQRFAGDDSQRLGDLNQLAQLPEERQIVLAVRGGYGVSRLLNSVDWQGIARRAARRPLLICGHSDFTAFQLGLLQQTAQITFSGPMLAGNFGAPQINDYTWRHFWTALREQTFALRWQSEAPAARATGKVWGGNLAMLVSLLGTPWFPEISDGILVVEDINEHPYRVERLLLQLEYAGVLARQRAIILGSFSNSVSNDYDAGYDFATMCYVLRERLSIPVITGLPFGHEQETVTLPLGARGELNHDGTHATLTLSGHPTLED
ncbi:muramoyltetrapeptide carboxypeptidase [Entomohabitans teleogrylli]|uniref:muramoyltetrapeptide carboxypeptidase n=1 Tax=Entomohabitans teleogrylli TaxID=1384589 RepID=UPI00073D5255|nr:muramoyltetrapeptide carboxypeptidase [Entomohabitans teleogrylli]